MTIFSFRFRSIKDVTAGIITNSPYFAVYIDTLGRIKVAVCVVIGVMSFPSFNSDKLSDRNILDRRILPSTGIGDPISEVIGKFSMWN